MPDLPSGTVTFLFTDIEGSTRLWEEQPDAMRLALARHDQIASSVIREFAGVTVKSRGEGDSLFVVFADPADGGTCNRCQRLLCSWHLHGFFGSLLSGPWTNRESLCVACRSRPRSEPRSG